jgi:hypothetical protein
LVLVAHGPLRGGRAASWQAGEWIVPVLLPASIAHARAVVPAAVGDDVLKDLFQPSEQLRYRVALELVKTPEGPEVNFLDGV